MHNVTVFHNAILRVYENSKSAYNCCIKETCFSNKAFYTDNVAYKASIHTNGEENLF